MSNRLIEVWEIHERGDDTSPHYLLPGEEGCLRHPDGCEFATRMAAVEEELEENDGFSTVTDSGDWSSVPMLAGLQLTKGTLVDVRWPDGSIIEKLAVKIESRSVSKSDHGHESHYTDQHAYVEIPFRSQALKLFLAEVDVRLNVRRHRG